MLISKLISGLITDLILDFGIASMLNHTINLNLVTKFMVWFTCMDAIPKFDIKSVIKSDDISQVNPGTFEQKMHFSILSTMHHSSDLVSKVFLV